MSSYDGSGIWSNSGRSLFKRGGTAMAMAIFVNFSDQVMKWQRSVRAKEEQVERNDDPFHQEKALISPK